MYPTVPECVVLSPLFRPTGKTHNKPFWNSQPFWSDQTRTVLQNEAAQDVLFLFFSYVRLLMFPQRDTTGQTWWCKSFRNTLLLFAGPASSLGDHVRPVMAVMSIDEPPTWITASLFHRIFTNSSGQPNLAPILRIPFCGHCLQMSGLQLRTLTLYLTVHTAWLYRFSRPQENVRFLRVERSMTISARGSHPTSRNYFAIYYKI